jgi:hypothetical protein
MSGLTLRRQWQSSRIDYARKSDGDPSTQKKERKKRCTGQEKPESITLGALVQPKGISQEASKRKMPNDIPTQKAESHSRVSKSSLLVLCHAELRTYD